MCSPVLQALILRIYSMARALQLLWSRCCHHCHRAAAHCSCCGASQRSLAPPEQIQRLRLRTTEFQKLPKHVAVIVDCNDEVDHCKGALRDEGQWMHERVAALACWCAGIGISALTVYDADGCLVDAVEELADAVNRRKVVAAIPSVRFDVCRGQGVVNTDAAEHELQTGAATRRRGGKRMHNQLGAHAAGAVDSAGGAEAKPKVDTTVTVLSAMDGREDIAQMARRLAADVAALSREPEVGQRGQGSPKVDEELVSAQLRAYNTSTSGGGAQSVLETDGPDLLMRFTPGGALRAALTTDGFPPWYLRLTEIQYASHLRLTEQSCD